MTNAKRTALTAASLLALLALLAGCAAAPTPTDECPLLGVATGNPSCLVDYYGSGGDQGDAGGDGGDQGDAGGDSDAEE